MQRFQQYIDGTFEHAASEFDSIDPAGGTVWARMPAASADDVDRAVRAAHRALNEAAWANLTASERGKLLYRLAELIERDALRLAELETRDTGKIIRETRSQIGYVAEYYRYYAGVADKIQGAWLPVDKPDMEVTLRREPVGVVAAIVPWNSQLFLSAVKIGPALAAGCTVVLKASEDGPAPLLEFARLVHEAGFPKGVVNIVTGFGNDCGRTLTSHPLVSHIAFTGGPETARHVVRNSADNLAAISLELGGKSPVLVFDDADLESTCNAVIAGIFAATGQSCVAGSRLIVQRGIHDALVERLTARARAIRIGDPQDMATEMGPLATRRQLEHIQRVLDASIEAGGRVVTGGSQPEGLAAGHYFLPTIVDCPNAKVPSVMEELFGPVLSVVMFDTEAEAIALANDTKYGLASGVFTGDLTRAHRLTRALRAGIVWVNTYRAVSPIVPFGGYGLSGLGREGGFEAVLEYTRTKSVWIRTSDEPIADPFVMR
ncbi:aldehyde dehydrogenase family protein [Burkholderia pseudomallei 1026b]|uniref:Aldehyde dehydrogenase family protein n=1 Tax=Burkholderia pseudomallei TaxID=28450 RepID=A0AA40JAL3_BURPE|nr:aldehyde dehydrogenase family protein [Burkholderia pseudomallei 1026b]KGS28799.1 aldehyde dehydrogenase family protein [Burkholderia pseudomallei MSHR5569]KGS76236.1 aldehyde dehydrogenase family protein [Burkholderia pseudomallei MSHR7500]KGS99785.1 aldehyde dehydrogenase family protein [Burkholderia pseudomallei]KGW65923.1 aldehyde dehydrogenase family protein [Burkholderia pseudomallei MSHR1029]KGX32001.1 aldehyde dehydrogenase family protein [Burkholderia pseudomallei MSHR2138]KKB7080